MDLPKSIFLLGLNEEGKFYLNTSSALPYALAGGILIELIRSGRLIFEDKKILVKSDESTDKPYYDLILNKISSSKKDRKLTYWVQKFGNSYREFRELIIQSLEKDNIIKTEKRKILFIFPSRRFPIQNISKKLELEHKIRNFCLADRKPDDEEMSLLALAHSMNAFGYIFNTHSENKTAKKKVKKLLEEHQFDKAMGKAISEAVTAALVAVSAGVTASAAASAATSS